MHLALLVTDLVDSTRQTAELGDEASSDLAARHDAIARELLVVHRGREIDKSDGFLLMFEDPDDAAAYARAYQAAIVELGLTSRAGIHLGPVVLRQTPAEHVARGAKPLEVDGLAKSVAARVMAVARGGQTLATRIAAPGCAISHGHWRMKGVSEPIELVEVDGDGVPPPDGVKAWRVTWSQGLWLPVRDVDRNLPAERDPFVGRSADLRTLAAQLDGGSRLVTVIGIGGTGKTRLVTHFAWTWLGDYPGGAWFCDLSEARSVEGVAFAVARAFDVPLGKDDPLGQLGNAIAARGRCLVLLDNFEQVARFASQSLGLWLDRAAQAQFVVTSREVLGLPGETALALAPLRRDEAVGLFEARARQARHDFALTDEVRADVEALVEQLDGLPLAIELAAARVRLMSPRTLLDRIGQRFELLASSGGRHTRQATLRAMLDWSWDLLSTDEQASLAQLSVFEGGFTLETAEAVLVLEELWPMDAVQALVDKSLVRAVGGDRFDLLVSVQVYAAEKLDETGGRGDAEERHGAHFAGLGTEEVLGELDLRGGGVERTRSRIGELDNVVAACRRAAARSRAGDDAAAARAVDAFAAAWLALELCGPLSIADDLGREVLDLPLSAAGRARSGLIYARVLRTLLRTDEARALLEPALAWYREQGDRRGEATALQSLGQLAEEVRSEEARGHLEAALRLYRDLGNRRGEAITRMTLGILCGKAGRPEASREHLEAALAWCQDRGTNEQAFVLANLGTLCITQGRFDEARARFEAALAVAGELGNRFVRGFALSGLAHVAEATGRLEEAKTHFEAALSVQRQTGRRDWEVTALANLGALLVRHGQLDEALGYLEAAVAGNRDLADRRGEATVLLSLAQLHRAQGRIEEARAALSASERIVRELGHRPELARHLYVRVLVEAEHEPEAARAVLAEIEAIAAEVDPSPESQFGRALAELRALVGAAAPDDPGRP